jgi:hypothetical protein
MRVLTLIDLIVFCSDAGVELHVDHRLLAAAVLGEEGVGGRRRLHSS